MPRIYAYVETEVDRREPIQPLRMEADSGSWIDRVFARLIINLAALDQESPNTETSISLSVEQWLSQEPEAFRALLATNFRSERERYLQDLSDALLGPTLSVLATHVSDT